MREEKTNVLLVIVSILIPLVGLILFLCWHKEKPKAAKVYGLCALVSAIVAFIGTVLIVLAGITVAQTVGNDAIIEKANESRIENTIASIQEKVSLATFSAYTEYVSASISDENANLSTYMNKELRKVREELSEEGADLTCKGNIVTIEIDGSTIKGEISDTGHIDWIE